MPTAYLDDLRPGQQFESGRHQITEADIIAFASEFDPQPFHLDPVAAGGSFFGTLVASGWHTAAVTMRLLVTGDMQIAGGVVGGGAELTWPQPTRPGDTLQVFSEVIAVRPSRSRPDRGIVTLRSETRNQHGEPVQVLVSQLIVPRKEPTGEIGATSGA